MDKSLALPSPEVIRVSPDDVTMPEDVEAERWVAESMRRHLDAAVDEMFLRAIGVVGGPRTPWQ